jgi:hypothetical protein
MKENMSKKHHQYKKILCIPFMETGYCLFNKKCHFAHGENELRPKTIRIKYKTKICKLFIENEKCPFDKQCFYAHGYEELRSCIKNPKYKTKKCKFYHELGYCSVPNCNFIHDEDNNNWTIKLNLNPWDGPLNLGLFNL